MDDPEGYGRASDDALMTAYAGGDGRAFEELFRRYRSSLFNYLLRATYDQALAEDLFQATFLHLHRSRKSYRPSSFKAFLFTIATNLLRDEQSRSEYRHRADTEDRLLHIMPAAGAMSAPSAEALTVAAETGRAMEQAIEALPLGMREVFLLSRYHELSVGEIARVLDISPGAVKVRLFRALAQLRRKLATHAD